MTCIREKEEELVIVITCSSNLNYQSTYVTITKNEHVINNTHTGDVINNTHTHTHTRIYLVFGNVLPVAKFRLRW